jgi:membrane-associated phospholipid phosphatase
MTATTLTDTRIQDRRHCKDAVIDLCAPGLLAKWPMIGLILFIFGGLVFGGLSYNLLAQGPLLAWDKALANTLPAIGLKSPGYVRVIMDAGFYIGKEVIIVVGLLLGLYFLYKRYWQELAMLAIGEAGTGLLFLSLTSLFARPRPPTQIWIIVNLPGFPSGHAVSVVVFYGLLAYLLAPKMPSAFWKGFVVAAALLIIGFVGFSRIFTGGHYLTDVLAGYAVGLAWAGMAYTLIEMYFQRRRSHNVKEG